MTNQHPISMADLRHMASCYVRPIAVLVKAERGRTNACNLILIGRQPLAGDVQQGNPPEPLLGLDGSE